MDAAIKLAWGVGGKLLVDEISKITDIPVVKKEVRKLGKEAIDTYVGRGTGAIKDATVNSSKPVVEESDVLNLQVEHKK